MLADLLFFLMTGATLMLLAWSGMELFQTPGRSAGRPAGGIAVAGDGSGRAHRAPQSRRRRLNRILYVVSLFPGGDDWIRGSERLLNRAGIRRKYALSLYIAGTLIWAGACSAGMLWLQRGNPISSMLGGIVAALMLGFMLPKLVLQRLVKRYRRKLQEALPDTVDLLGIVLGTGLALDQSMMRVSEEMQYIYPELANEFATVVMQVRAGPGADDGIQAVRAADRNRRHQIPGGDDRAEREVRHQPGPGAESLCRCAAHAKAPAGRSGDRKGRHQDAVPDRVVHPAGAVRDHAGAGHAERAERSEDARWGR